MKPSLLQFLLAALLLVAGLAHGQRGFRWEVGEVDFLTSTNSSEVAMLFNRGVALLHNFWYEEAQIHFKQIRTIEKNHAMSYWGEAFSYKQMLWETEQYEQGNQVLQELDSLESYQVTEKERMFIDALRVIFGNGSVAERDLKFSQEMKKIYDKYPGDLEAASFYAVSLLATVGVERGMLERGKVALPEADRVIQEILDANPNHPGALHYRIHNLDDPYNGTSARALDAASKYGPSSPSSPHALHMPCHTYLRNGRWIDAMHANELSINAADVWIAHRQHPISLKDFHSIEYQQYVYLQQGRFQSAMQFVDLNFAVAFDMDSYSSYARGMLMEGRQLAETLFWTLDVSFHIPSEFPERLTCPTCEDPSYMDGLFLVTAYANTASYFARGLAAATKADDVTAFQAIHFLENEAELLYPKRPAHADNTEVMSMVIRGVLLFEEGNQVEGLETLHEAFNWETSTDPSKDGPPIPFIPSFELYAKYLLKANNPTLALEVLTSGNYTSTRNRGATIYMFATANAMLGNTVAACDMYQRFVDQFAIRDLNIGEVEEAQEYLVSECGVHQPAATVKRGLSPLPKTFAHLDLESESEKKREMLKAKVFNWEKPLERSAHC